MLRGAAAESESDEVARASAEVAPNISGRAWRCCWLVACTEGAVHRLGSSGTTHSHRGRTRAFPPAESNQLCRGTLLSSSALSVCLSVCVDDADFEQLAWKNAQHEKVVVEASLLHRSMWCSRMNTTVAQAHPESSGFAYASEHIPTLEAAFTLALQAVLMEQPADPVAWVAGFLGELAAERADEEELKARARASAAARQNLAQTAAALDDMHNASTKTAAVAPSASTQSQEKPIRPVVVPSEEPANSVAAHTEEVANDVEVNARDPFNLGIVSAAEPATAKAAAPPSAQEAEVNEIMNELSASSEEALDRLAISINAVDREGRGRLGLRDFSRAFSQARIRMESSKIARIHAFFAKDVTGEVTVTEFASALTGRTNLSARVSLPRKNTGGASASARGNSPRGVTRSNSQTNYSAKSHLLR